MGLGDKISNEAEELKGKAKESYGDATDNESMQAEGKADQASAGVKQAGEKVKDAEAAGADFAGIEDLLTRRGYLLTQRAWSSTNRRSRRGGAVMSYA